MRSWMLARALPATGPLGEITRGQEKFTQRVGIDGETGHRWRKPWSRRSLYSTPSSRKRPARQVERQLRRLDALLFAH